MKNKKIILCLCIILIGISLLFICINFYKEIKTNNKKEENQISDKELEKNIKESSKDKTDIIVEGKTIKNKRETILMDRDFSGLIFKNISLEKNNDTITFKATIINDTKKTINANKKIIFYDINMNPLEIKKIEIKGLHPKEKMNISITTKKDVIYSYAFNVE